MRVSRAGKYRFRAWEIARRSLRARRIIRYACHPSHGANYRANFPVFCAANDLSSGSSLLGTVVVRCRDLFLGYRAGYDTALKKMTKNDVGIGYGCTDVDFHLRCTRIPHEYGLSVLYKGKGQGEGEKKRSANSSFFFFLR